MGKGIFKLDIEGLAGRNEDQAKAGLARVAKIAAQVLNNLAEQGMLYCVRLPSKEKNGRIYEGKVIVLDQVSLERNSNGDFPKIDPGALDSYLRDECGIQPTKRSDGEYEYTGSVVFEVMAEVPEKGFLHGLGQMVKLADPKMRDGGTLYIRNSTKTKDEVQKFREGSKASAEARKDMRDDLQEALKPVVEALEKRGQVNVNLNADELGQAIGKALAPLLQGNAPENKPEVTEPESTEATETSGKTTKGRGKAAASGK